MGRHRHSLARRLLLAAIALGCALGAGELAVRMLPEETLGFRCNGEVFRRPREFIADQTKNRLGFHDVEHTAIGEPGVQRLILLGDSFVESKSVAMHEIVGQRLQHHLETASGTRWEVMSLGVSGWGQTHQLEALRRFGPRFHPAVVVTLFLHMNDLSDNAPELKTLSMQEQRAMSRVQPGWGTMRVDQAPLLLVRSSVLNQLLSHRLAQLSVMRSEKIPTSYLVYEDPIDVRFERAWRITARAIRATHALCKSLGARYLIASAPTPHGVLGPDAGLDYLTDAYPAMAERDWDLTAPDRRMARICKRNAIPFLQLEPEFARRTASGEVLHFPFDGHWNAAGNDLGGRLIADFVAANG